MIAKVESNSLKPVAGIVICLSGDYAWLEILGRAADADRLANRPAITAELAGGPAWQSLG
jgi:hypothetical protein